MSRDPDLKLAVLPYDCIGRKLRPRFLASFLPRYLRYDWKIEEFVRIRARYSVMANNVYKETAAQINKAQIELQIRLEQVSKLKSEYTLLSQSTPENFVESD